MTPDDITERLTRLRLAQGALRDRSRSELIDVLAAVFDGWRSPESPWRKGLEADLPEASGFSPATVREGLARGFEPWSGDALRSLAAREFGDEAAPETRAAGFETTAVSLAGSIPMPSLLAMVAPLLSRSAVLAKTASRDPVTPGWVARSIGDVDSELGACVDVVTFRGDDEACTRALLSADCICATGSDSTIASIRSMIRPPRRALLDGHRLSAAAIAGNADEDLARRIALDVALWDQLGCLSPVIVFAVGRDGVLADRLAEQLAIALEAAERSWPRGAIDPAAARDIVRERSEGELRAASGRRVIVRAAQSTAWTVIREDDCALRPAPLHRFVRVVPVADADALVAALAPLGPHLAAVAIEGFGDGTDKLGGALCDLGASRICAPGTLQSPPLGWHHAGRPVLASLARFCDMEVLR